MPTFISLSLLSELGEVDGVFVSHDGVRVFFLLEMNVSDIVDNQMLCDVEATEISLQNGEYGMCKGA